MPTVTIRDTEFDAQDLLDALEEAEQAESGRDIHRGTGIQNNVLVTGDGSYNRDVVLRRLDEPEGTPWQDADDVRERAEKALLTPKERLEQAAHDEFGGALHVADHADPFGDLYLCLHEEIAGGVGPVVENEDLPDDMSISAIRTARGGGGLGVYVTVDE